MREGLGQQPYSVATGKPGFEKVFGLPSFDWLAKHPAEASMVSETMVGFHGAEPAAVTAAYDYSQFDTVVDVGGATGNLLAAVLGHHAKPRGILFIVASQSRCAGATSNARTGGSRHHRIR